MSEMGEVREDHQEITRLSDLQAIPAIVYNEQGEPTAQVVSFHIDDVQQLCRDAFMAGHKHHITFEQFVRIVASWRSYDQRSKFNNANIDLENVQKDAAENVRQFLEKSN